MGHFVHAFAIQNHEGFIGRHYGLMFRRLIKQAEGNPNVRIY
jgi:hypothetical protein